MLLGDRRPQVKFGWSCMSVVLDLTGNNRVGKPKQIMAAYLMCITISGGVPIFNRKFGDIKTVCWIFVFVIFLNQFNFMIKIVKIFLQLPYPLLASLNGVALFAQSQDVTLLTTLTKDCKLLWRDYQNRYIIIKRYKVPTCPNYLTLVLC